MKIKRTYILIVLLFFAFVVVQAQSERYSDKFNLKELVKGSDYLANVIIVKLKPNKRSVLDLNINELKGILDNTTIIAEKMFKGKMPLEIFKNKLGQDLVDLSLIYTISFEGQEPVENIIDKLYVTGNFEYAEPYFISQLLYTPNDPGLNNQYYLQRIKALEGWDVFKGDTNVVIGIIDTGTELNHPDLINNIKYNSDDIIDGIDNDNDGFVDNYYGWDLGENDNDPTYTMSVAHGVHVCGIAAAKADNGTGIAGVGFKCKFLPIKVSNAYGIMTQSYQGIVYAADKNCRVINCSWGRIGWVGQFGQSIVNYATYNKGAVVVAAAGNLNNEQLYYPASYQNVISVAATNVNDLKWPESSYNTQVDLCAPGHQIYSTWANGTYLSSNGTSMATPVVSGCAAIVASFFPNYCPAQIVQQLKVTSDVIDTITANMTYANKLGSGRVNLFKALTQNSPSVNMISLNYTDEEFGQFSPGDTLLITGKFVNYLDTTTTNLICTLKSLSSYVTVLDSVIHFLAPINTLDTVDNLTPFRIVIKTNMPLSTKADFRLSFSDVNYNEKQYFSKTFNIDYINIDTNKVKTTFTGKSRIGYNDISRSQGIGLLYENSPVSQLYYGGLIVGVSPTQVSDNIYGSFVGSLNNGFFNLVKAHRVMPSVFSDFDVQAIFNDSLVGTNKMNIEVVNNMYAWNNLQDEKFIIDEYFIVNKGQVQLNNLYAGLFMDWDIEDNRYHRTDFEETLKLGYSYSTLGSNYTATKLLTTGNYRFYGFDNLSGFKINDGFTNIEKYNTLRTNKFQAGSNSIDNDIATLFGNGPFSINPGDTIKIAFAIIVGDYLTDIMQSAVNAQNRYDGLNSYVKENPGESEDLLIYPNPAKDEVLIFLKNTIGNNYSIDVLDNIGKVVKTEQVKLSQNEYHSIKLNIKDLKSGIYFIRINALNKVETKKLIIY